MSANLKFINGKNITSSRDDKLKLHVAWITNLDKWKRKWEKTI